MVHTHLHLPGTINKFHCPRHKEILDDYNEFNIYIIVRSLSDTTNFGRLDVQHYVMKLGASRVVSMLSCQNINTIVLSTLFILYLCESYEQYVYWVLN